MAGLSITSEVRGEERLQEVYRVLDGMEGARINPVFGRAAVNVTREHLFARNTANPNKMGGPRTNFYAQAARGTHFELRPNGFLLGINQVGIRQRWQGGTITPKQAKYLTIPANAEAYGKRARDFSNLVFGMTKKGQAFLATAQATTVARTRGINPNAGYSYFKPGGSQGGKIMFWLEKVVVQAPDPDVLPTKEKFIEAVVAAGEGYVKRLLARKGAREQ